MKFAILCNTEMDHIQYTVSVLTHIAKFYGHEIVEPEDADMLLVSVCDVHDLGFAEKVRNKYPNKIIMIGGHAAVYYKLWFLFGDYVNIGQGFELLKCQSIDEMKELKCVTWEGKDEIIHPSNLIEWENVPVANVSKGGRYYWGSVGCKNKCSFCVTSWTNTYQTNSPARVNKVLTQYPNCIIVTNDSAGFLSRPTQSIMLKDFLKAPLRQGSIYRLGIEFATEERRKKYGKSFTDSEFVAAMLRAARRKVRLRLFCITGLDTMEEWDGLFGQIPPIYDNAGAFRVKFTNLDYQMFTPMRHERYDISLDNMFNTKIAEKFLRKYMANVRPLRTLPCSSKQTTLLRNVLYYTTNREEYEGYKMVKKYDDERATLAYIKDMGVFDNDYTDTIKFDLKPIKKRR